MAYFLILPAWLFTTFVMGVITLCSRFVEPMRAWFHFSWRILLWSSVGFLSANLFLLLLFLIPGMAGDAAPNAPDAAKYGFVALLIVGPIIASVVGFFGGIALGIWLSIRAKTQSAPNPSFNPDATSASHFHHRNAPHQ